MSDKDMFSLAVFELSNYEYILQSAVDSNNIEIYEFCRLYVYPGYVDLAMSVDYQLNDDLVDLYGNSIDPRFMEDY